MKRNICLFIIILLHNIIVSAQDTTCNRAVQVKSYEKELPKEVCIPQGYLISDIYEKTDINGDSLNDFIFDWNKNPLKDGDTIYVTIYLQNPDGTYKYFRTFNNLYPIYFKSYSLDYIPQDTSLILIHRKYENFYPLHRLKFEKDLIKITIRNDAETDIVVTYRFDKTINNWRFEKSEEYYFIDGTLDPINLSDKLGPTIDNFTYFYWIEE
ncbi:MAG: hypothetical protein QXU40_02515 [Candidatus Pacearchaeota archaeon]